MTYVYIIIVYNLLHQQQAILPGSYTDLNTCKAALVQTHLSFGNWGECTALAAAPPKGRLQ